MTHKGMKRVRSASKNAPILFVSGDKGGVGKSFCARAIASYLLAHDHGVRGFDGDPRNGHLERHMDGEMSVCRMNLHLTEQLTEMLNLLQDIPGQDAIIVDLPGNIGGTVLEQRHRIWGVCEALGRDIKQVWVASEEQDSIWLLREGLKFADASQTVFVKNERFGSASRDFSLWEKSQTRTDFITEGGVEGRLPLLPIRPRTAIAEKSLSFSNIAPAQLMVADKIDFDLWWSATQTEVNRWLNKLGVR